MEPGSVRALLCTSKQPLGGQVTQIMLNDYFEYYGKREASGQAPATSNRCIEKVGRGRCRKHVSQAALCQVCSKHGNSWVYKGGIYSPKDRDFILEFMFRKDGFHHMIPKAPPEFIERIFSGERRNLPSGFKLTRKERLDLCHRL